MRVVQISLFADCGEFMKIPDIHFYACIREVWQHTEAHRILREKKI